MKAEEFESEWKRYCDSKGGGAVTMNLKDMAQHFAKFGYEQAEKDFIEKAAKWLKSCLDNGCWVANNLCDYDKQGIVQGFKEMMSEKYLF